MSPGSRSPPPRSRSVGGMNAWASSRCGSYESDVPSGGGKQNPALLSNGSPESGEKRPFHINVGKNAVLSTIGARRMFRGPRRSGPDDPVVVDADRDRLAVAESVRRRVAAGACVVTVQPGDRVEPEQAAGVGEARIEPPAKPRGQRRLDPAREPLSLELCLERCVERTVRWAVGHCGREHVPGCDEQADDEPNGQVTAPVVAHRRCSLLGSRSALQRIAVSHPAGEVDRIAPRAQRLEADEVKQSAEAVAQVRRPVPGQ